MGEDVADRDVDLKRLSDPAQEPHGEHRGAPEREEVVPVPDARHSEHLREELGQERLHLWIALRRRLRWEIGGVHGGWCQDRRCQRGGARCSVLSAGTGSTIGDMLTRCRSVTSIDKSATANFSRVFDIADFTTGEQRFSHVMNGANRGDGRTGIHQVVRADSGHFSILAPERALPAGWALEGFQGSFEACMDEVDRAWPDVRAAPSASSDFSTLDRFLAEAAVRYSQEVALVVGSEKLTYKELFTSAGAVAASIATHQCGPGDFVGVAVARDAASIIGLLGVVLSGAAYVPLDTTAPPSRLRNIAAQAGVRLVTGAVTSPAAQALDLPAIAADVARPSGPGPVGAASGSSPAYAIFTSGSTGRPKGVVVSHAAVVSSTTARFAVFPRDPMTYLMLAPLGFDAAVAGLFFTLAAGGRLVMPTAEEVVDPGLIAELVTRYGVSHLDGVPGQYAAVLEFHGEKLDGLGCVVVAGEALSQGLVRRHLAKLPHVPLFNEYGPTENTVWSTWHRCTEVGEGRFAPIGTAVAGVTVEVVDDALDLLPPGEVGQIAIAGRQLADGYLGQPGMTAAKFVPHPRAVGARLLLSGDLGFRDAAGDLVYCGRADSMIKVRGFRVELAEVEGWFKLQPEVSDAVVVPEGIGESTRLAVVIADSSASDPGSMPGAQSRSFPSTWSRRSGGTCSSCRSRPTGRSTGQRLANS